MSQEKKAQDLIHETIHSIFPLIRAMRAEDLSGIQNVKKIQIQLAKIAYSIKEEYNSRQDEEE